MKEMKKSLMIWAIILVAVNSILILLTTTFNVQNSVLSYILINLELLIDLYCVYHITRKQNVYNLSYINNIGIPFALILIISGINLVIPNNFLVIIFAILIVAYQLIKIIKVSLAVDIITEGDTKLAESTNFVENLRLELDVLYGNCKDNDIKRKMKEILEVAKYMSPVENNDLASLKDNILSNLNELKNENNKDKKLTIIGKLSDLLIEYNKRNRR